ncbi:MAG: lipoprotein-releasing ABC transporter permease subunit [Paracoccaceae bacterium]
MARAATNGTPPFAGFEWAIAWRYLRARRRDGGISVIAWYALIGVMLGVATLIVVQAVMIGFREEFTDRILGANAHVTVYSAYRTNEFGQRSRAIEDYDALARKVAGISGVARAAPIIHGQVMATANGRNAGVEVFGERLDDVRSLPLIANPERAQGELSRLEEGVAIGEGVARELGLGVGDPITLISPDGVPTPFGGTSPRIVSYEVVYIFRVGRFDVDRTRLYMPFSEAQSYFNREGTADEIEVLVDNPQEVDLVRPALLSTLGSDTAIWTWKDASGAFLKALDTERRVMFIILSLVVVIAALNIISGLVMLVKNKGRDIGILRTMGLTQGSVMRVFFICGSLIGIIGTVLGVILGCLFVIYIQDIQAVVEWVIGGHVWDPSIRYLTEIPARLRWQDLTAAMVMGIGLSLVITLLPARNAARLNPVEALRYE